MIRRIRKQTKLWGVLPHWKTPSDELENWIDKEFERDLSKQLTFLSHSNS